MLLGYNDRHSPFLLISQFSDPKRRNLCLYIVRRSLPQRTHLTQVESSQHQDCLPSSNSASICANSLAVPFAWCWHCYYGRGVDNEKEVPTSLWPADCRCLPLLVFPLLLVRPPPPEQVEETDAADLAIQTSMDLPVVKERSTQVNVSIYSLAFSPPGPAPGPGSTVQPTVRLTPVVSMELSCPPERN